MKSDKNSFEKDAIWLCKNLSQILEKQFKIQTGLYFPISVFSPFLNIGLTEAVLAESENEFLKTSLLIILGVCQLCKPTFLQSLLEFFLVLLPF